MQIATSSVATSVWQYVLVDFVDVTQAIVIQLIVCSHIFICHIVAYIYVRELIRR
jgi:hypothetical protein